MFFHSFSNNILNLISAKAKTISSNGYCYLGLLTAAPAADGSSLNEISKNDYPSYARILLNAYDSQNLVNRFGDPAKGVITNDKPFSGDSQAEETGGWPEATHWCIFDAKTGGYPIVADVFRDPDGSPDANGLYPQTTLKVGYKQVPVFRKGALQLTLK